MLKFVIVFMLFGWALISDSDQTPLSPVITLENAVYISQLHVSGQGSGEYSLAWSPIGDELFLSTAIGIWVYKADSETQDAYLIEDAFMPSFGQKERFAAYSPMRGVEIFDLNSLQVIDTYSAEEFTTISTLSLNLEGTLLGIADYQGALGVLRLEDHVSIQMLRDDGSPVSVMRFSDDGRYLVTGDLDGTVVIWDLSPANIVGQARLKNPIRDIHLSGNEIYAIDAAAALIHWQIGDTISSIVPQIDTGTRIHAAIDSTGSLIAVEQLSGDVILWNIKNQNIQAVLERSFPIIDDFSFSPDGLRLAVVGVDAITVWDLVNNSLLRKFPFAGHPRAIRDVAVSPSTALLFSVSYDDGIRAWNLPSLRSMDRLIPGFAGEPITSFALGSDYRVMAYAVWNASAEPRPNASVILHNMLDHTDSRILSGSNSNVDALSISPSGDVLAIGGWDTYQMRLWDIKNMKEISTVQMQDRIVDLDFISDQYLIMQTSIGTIEIWNMDMQKASLLTEGSSFGISQLTAIIAISSGDGFVKFLDAVNFDTQYDLELPGRICSFDPSGQIIVMCDSNRITLWNAITGENLSTLNGHVGSVSKAVFSEDGRNIISAGSDGTVRVWGISASAAADID